MSSNNENIGIYDIYSKALPIHKEKNLTLVRYELLNRRQILNLDKSDAMVVIAISPLETHGYFLPVGSDFMEAILSIELIKKLLKERKLDRHYTIVEAPALPLGTGTLRGMLGTVHIKHATFRNVVAQYLEGFVKAGFTKILITSVHHGLIHSVAIEEAAMKVMKKYKETGVRIVSPLNWIVKKIYVDDPKKTWNSITEILDQPPLSEEEYDALFQDHHASIMEIALLKKINFNLVNLEYKNSKPHIEGIVHGIKSLLSPRWANLGGPEGCGYNGHPAMADNRNWYVLYEKLIKDVGEEFIDALYEKNTSEFEKYTKSFMWPIWILKTNFKWRFSTIFIACILFLLFVSLFPWNVLPIVLFGTYNVIRIFIAVRQLKQ